MKTFSNARQRRLISLAWPVPAPRSALPRRKSSSPAGDARHHALGGGDRYPRQYAVDAEHEAQFDGIVDGIVAEDMGKFPDTNLAESLQRISGVSIDRSNGEGQKSPCVAWARTSTWCC
jgi:hypothetical protein